LTQGRLVFFLLVTFLLAGVLVQQRALPVEAHVIQTTLRFQNSDKCLTAYGFDNGGPAMQWTCGAGNNVSIEDAGGGYHYIRFLHSNKCLTVNGNARLPGGTLDQWDCLGQPNQKWTGIFRNGLLEVHTSQLNPNLCITVAGDAQWDGAAVNQWLCVGQGNQSLSVGEGPPPPCDPSYPDVCIAPYPPDLDCGEIPYRRFRVIGSDPHGLDGDRDGIGCEV
jgi:hypothetical protein